MPGRLNSFQRTMLDWNALHPYNAIHGVYIAANFDLNRLHSVIATTLESLGLTNLALDADHRTYEFHGGTTTSDINVLATGGDGGATMATEIERQLNTAFPSQGRINPFRFFVAPGTEAFMLGLVYFHPIAGGETIVRLLKQLMDAYLSDVPPTNLIPFVTTPGRAHRHPGINFKQIWKPPCPVPGRSDFCPAALSRFPGIEQRVYFFPFGCKCARCSPRDGEVVGRNAQ